MRRPGFLADAEPACMGGKCPERITFNFRTPSQGGPLLAVAMSHDHIVAQRKENDARLRKERGCTNLWKEVQDAQTIRDTGITLRKVTAKYNSCMSRVTVPAGPQKQRRRLLLIGVAILATILLLRKRSI